MTLMKSLFRVKRSDEITLIVIDKDKNCQCAVKWAMDNLLSNDDSECIFLHVRSSHLNSKDVAAAPKGGRSPNNNELQQLFLPYRAICARKGITAKEVVLHDIDASNAVIHYAVDNSIDNIVIGASSRNGLMRKFKSSDMASSLLKFAPESCAVHVISSKGRVHAAKLAIRPLLPIADANTNKNLSHFIKPDISGPIEMNRSEFSCDSMRTEATDSNSTSTETLRTSSYGKFKSIPLPVQSMDSHTPDSVNRKSVSDRSDFSVSLSFRSPDISENLNDSFVSQNPVTTEGLDVEIRRLRLELKQCMEIYDSVCKEAVAAKGKAMKLQELKAEETRKLEEFRLEEQEVAVDLVEIERRKVTAAKKAAQTAQYLTDVEAQKRNITEMETKYEAEGKRRGREALSQKNIWYKKYTIEEIETATNYFSHSQKIGEGAYGPVYKAVLDHTAVAIKVLRPDRSQGLKQFKQEIEVLSSMKHPNLVLLLGACPEYGCLVYEYMENGSLEDRLFRKGNSPSIPWRTRFKIAADIATGLLFLHQNKPDPLVHRDLKPANILLDKSFLSKISDVGLARLVPPSVADSVTQYHMTEAAGTFWYIDPEYQQTGMLGVKSDLYSLGVMLLQIITAKPPMGLSHQVENAIENGTFSEMLDQTVNDWPVEEALSFAKIALHCCELRKRDRPDLATVLLPELIRLRDCGLRTGANDDVEIVTSAPFYPILSEITKANQEGMRINPNVEMEIQRRSIREKDGSC